MSALHLAAFNGHQQEVHFLLTVEKSDTNIADSTGTHPLTWSSLNGHYEVAKILLDHGVRVNAQGGVHCNALLAACSKGHENIVQVILKRGADIDSHN